MVFDEKKNSGAQTVDGVYFFLFFHIDSISGGYIFFFQNVVLGGQTILEHFFIRTFWGNLDNL